MTRSPETQILIHIGLHKTGTSAIQSYLSAHSDKLMRKYDVLYVEAGRDVEAVQMHAGHHRLAWTTVERYAERKGATLSDELWHAVLREVASKKPRTAVISSEFFWPAKKNEIRKMHRLLQKYNVRIILYTRNYRSIALSSYKQLIKNGKYKKSFTSYIKDRKWYFDYDHIINNWRGVFGDENIDLRYYDAVSDQLIQNFVQRIGVDGETEYHLEQNVSPPNCAVYLVRLLNHIECVTPAAFKKWIHRARRNIVAQRQPGKVLTRLANVFFPEKIIGPAQLKLLREETEEMRSRFLENYVASEDRHLFRI